MTNPVALVSGGSRGIGQRIVYKLASEGYRVSFCYQSDHDAARRTLDEAARMSGVDGTAVVSHKVDIRDHRACSEFVAATTEAFGEPPHCVVANAGVTDDRPLVAMPDESWQSVIDTNLTGTFNLCQPAVFEMLKQRSGSVIVISSIAGTAGNPGQTNYAATKAGLIGFVKSLAKEVGRRGIRANAVVPGFITSDMTAALNEAQTEKATAAIALRRFGEGAEVAEAVAFLASDRASYITGSVLHVDGGVSI